jgi:hypothetical protein
VPSGAKEETEIPYSIDNMGPLQRQVLPERCVDRDFQVVLEILKRNAQPIMAKRRLTRMIHARARAISIKDAECVHVEVIVQ